MSALMERPYRHDEHQRERDDPRRIATLHEMLQHYNHARSEASGGAGGGGARHEARLLGLDPTTFTSSYRELERCLERLRWLALHGRPMIERGVSSGAAWWHIRQRYLEVREVRHEVHLRRTHSGDRVPAHLPRNMEVVGRPTVLQGRSQRLLVRVWDPGVDQRVVEAGLRWISREFRGEPAAGWKSS